MDVAKLLRDTRRSAGLKQAQLAYRAGTTQSYVSRVERGLANPSITTLERLFAVMGRELRLTAVPGDLGNASRTELRRDFLELTPEERIDQAFTLSEFLTGLAVNARRPAGRWDTRNSRIAAQADDGGCDCGSARSRDGGRGKR